MTQTISEVRQELDAIAIQLDNYYVQIKIHHEREMYHKALEIFSIISPLQKRASQLQEKLRRFRKIEEMKQQGIFVKRVKKVDETSFVLGR